MDESVDGDLMAQLIAGTSQAPCPQGEEVGAAGLALWPLIGLIGVLLGGSRSVVAHQGQLQAEIPGDAQLPAAQSID